MSAITRIHKKSVAVVSNHWKHECANNIKQSSAITRSTNSSKPCNSRQNHSNSQEPCNSRRQIHEFACVCSGVVCVCAVLRRRLRLRRNRAPVVRNHSNSQEPCNCRQKSLEARIRQNRVTVVRNHSKHEFANRVTVVRNHLKHKLAETVQRSS